MTTSNPQLSLVIPAYNEAALLPRLLNTVAAARRRFQDGVNEVEVIVADNASTDATAEIARSCGCRVVREEKRVIGASRNAGAREARGRLLCFVDADSRIHPQTFNAVARALVDPAVIGGATGIRPERFSPGLAATLAAFLPLVWLTRFDTGVVFCRRDDFEAVGGYDERLRYAEDIRFYYDLWRRGRQRGQHLIRLPRVKAVASTRKFDRYGDWHYFPMTYRFLCEILLGSGEMARFGEGYWYDRGKGGENK